MKDSLTDESKVEEMVFVALPYQEQFKEIFNKWRLNKDQMVSGPYTFLSNDQKIDIFRTILKEVLSPEELESDTEKIKSTL